jgi:hypothetical protein
MRFSERYGYRQVHTAIQKESMDEDLRNTLWSALKVQYWDTVAEDSYLGFDLRTPVNRKMLELFRRLWFSFFKKPLDTLPMEWQPVLVSLRRDFFSWSWHEVYDFIEFVAQHYPDKQVNDGFIANCNQLLEREMSAYRFVGQNIAPITSEEEITAINDALTTEIDPVREHINSALEKLTDRKNPDYRNSIKESISAVESLVIKATGSDKGTLGQLLKILEGKTDLHPALKGAFEKLYGYTSDAGGIRHALLEKNTVTFEQAKFMLVVCSAFTNYVLSELKP